MSRPARLRTGQIVTSWLAAAAALAYIPLLLRVLAGKLAPVAAVSTLMLSGVLVITTMIIWGVRRLTHAVRVVQAGPFQTVESRDDTLAIIRSRSVGITPRGVVDAISDVRRDAYWGAKADIYTTLLEERDDDPQ